MSIKIFRAVLVEVESASAIASAVSTGVDALILDTSEAGNKQVSRYPSSAVRFSG